MMDVPIVLPVTTPDDEPIVAFVLLLDQEPPSVELPSVLDKPTQTFSVPVIDAGNGLTVITLVALQPPTVYDIVAVPALIPVTTPEDEPTEALELLLLQVPPEVPSVSKTDAP